MEILIFAIQVVGGLSLIFWVIVFSRSLLPLGSNPSIGKKISFFKVILVLCYPLFLGFSYWYVDLNLVQKRYEVALAWSISPVIIFFVILMLVTKRNVQSKVLSKYFNFFQV